MKTIRDILIKLFNILYWLLFQYSKYVLVAVVFITCVQVVLRNVFGGGLRWGQEVSLLLIVWMTFLAMAIGAEKSLHISVELFYHWFPRPVQKFCDVVRDLVILMIGGFFTIYGVQLIKNTMNSTLAATKWPAATLYLTIPIGGICMVIFKLYDLAGWKKYKKTDLDEDPAPEAADHLEH